MSVTILVTFLADAVVLTARAFIEHQWTSSVLAYYIAVSWLSWTIGMVCLTDETYKFGEWNWVQYIFWMAAALGETMVGWLWTVGMLRPKPGTIFSLYDYIFLGIFIVRYVMEVLTVLLCVIQMFSRRQHNASEREPLLGVTATTETYGTTAAAEGHDETSRKGEPSAFSNFFQKMRKLLPYIWPHKSIWLQLLVVVCFLLMITGIFVNVLVALAIGRVVDGFEQDKGKFAWGAVLVYVGLRFLQGGSGLIQALQNWLWIPIGQYTTREISVKMFSHLHGLSLQFHINRKTGEVLRVMDRGTNSIVQLLSQILFQVFPALANIVVAVFVCATLFTPPFGLIVFITMSLYLFVTISLTEWRTKYRRTMIELDNSARTKAVDSLLNFETVKYYGAEDFEINRYKNAVIEYQKADWLSSTSLNILNLAQNAVISGGLLAGCLLFAWEVAQGRLTSGAFVTFNIYMMQLYTPLHFFGTYYRMIQSNFIDMEKMLALFEEQQTVKDVPGAKNLAVTDGHVVFDNVAFSYDPRQTALNGISFSIPKGATVALVGPSGGGKSTILRLLFRFYDPDSGHIYIDGQDIKKVRQESLRHNIGVVPQDTVLFNDTVLYNIGYGNLNAPEDAIFKAAKAAQIHDKILQFPDGYETRVGERGLRLSGGEKQRVAIARTILKDPPIILLDEATSALDTGTERQIQQALSIMTKDRTTLVIAHRLSTIVNADLILVIKDGRVVESGNHEELIKQGEDGVYYEMWQKQLHDDNDTETNGLHINVPESNRDEIVSSPTEMENSQQQEQEQEQEPQQSGSATPENQDEEGTTTSNVQSSSKNRKKKKRSKSRKGTIF
ncbi:hypothetical protein BDA99DRAFT_444174 [Phascolomyces articulosus]|uniref:Uncharacterized protein n=1 Tax=Phascolomyces articulosus TaxID=60185 RepID=A0AAD5JSY2_9FUNG|nr:hypothetical protein BDA99DRAFT_444174 [Phascolomyces articulosus]